MAGSHPDNADDSPAGVAPAGGEDRLDEEKRAQYVEELGMVFAQHGWSRMAGRVLAFLVLNSAPYVSSAELAHALKASAGSISTATRELIEPGYIRQVAVPGSRSHHFRAEDDVFGTFIASEHRYLRRNAALYNEIADALGDGDERARRRVETMRDYNVWLEDFYAHMRDSWEEFKRGRAAEREP